VPEIAPINSFIETASGKRFYFDAPEFDIEDIAFHLSNLCRFTGAVRFYSVAEHCVMVSHLTTGDPLEALLHDGLEAYITDVSSPLKRRPEMTGYRQLEKQLYPPFAAHFGLQASQSIDTHAADTAAFYIESAVLRKSAGREAPGYAEHEHMIGSYPVHCWPPGEAHLAFMNRYEGLMRNRHIGAYLQRAYA
jgi:hypothetical protein